MKVVIIFSLLKVSHYIFGVSDLTQAIELGVGVNA
jgi:hypothetical protein